MIDEVEAAAEGLRAFLEWVEHEGWKQDLSDWRKRGIHVRQRRNWADDLVEEHGEVLLRVAEWYVARRGE